MRRTSPCSPAFDEMVSVAGMRSHGRRRRGRSRVSSPRISDAESDRDLRLIFGRCITDGPGTLWLEGQGGNRATVPLKQILSLRMA